MLQKKKQKKEYKMQKHIQKKLKVEEEEMDKVQFGGLEENLKKRKSICQKRKEELGKKCCYKNMLIKIIFLYT